MDTVPERQKTCFDDLVAWISSILTQHSSGTSQNRSISHTTIQTIEKEVQKKEDMAVLFLRELS